MAPPLHQPPNSLIIRHKRLAKGGQATIYLCTLKPSSSLSSSSSSSSSSSATTATTTTTTTSTYLIEKVFHHPKFHDPSPLPSILFPRSGPTTRIKDTSVDTLQRIYTALGETELVVKILKFPTRERQSMLLEYCEGGDLQNLVVANERSGVVGWPEGFVWHVFLSLLRTLTLVHTGLAPDQPAASTPKPTTATTTTTRITRSVAAAAAAAASSSSSPFPPNWTPITHRDIKPDNILLSPDPSNPTSYPKIKLADFDLATFYTPSDPTRHTRHRGLRFWSPPEQFNAVVPYAAPAGDVWAVGAVVYCLATGRVLTYYSDQEPEHWGGVAGNSARAGKITKRKKRFLPLHYSHKLEECMLMALEPLEQRATAVQLREVVGTAEKAFREKFGRPMPREFVWG